KRIIRVARDLLGCGQPHRTHAARTGAHVMVHIRTILVPCDASELAEKSLAVAFTMAERFESRLVLLHVRPSNVSLDPLEFDRDLSDVDVEGSSLMGIARRVLAQGPYRIADERIAVEVRSG